MSKRKMSIAQKMKTVAVKCQPPRRSRERIIEMCNVGAAPGYETNIDGSGRTLKDAAISKRRYEKNMMKIKGLCGACPFFNPKNKSVGGHCKLPEEKWCDQDERELRARKQRRKT